MKVLLINPNRYAFPPVPPIGLEHLSAALENNGHETRLLDLCFSESPYEDLDREICSFEPDIAGITVRNVDTVLYHTNEFFLDNIKDLIGYIKSGYGLKTIIGGAGVSVNPEGVIEYLGADYACEGPAEDSINGLLDDIRTGVQAKRVYYGKYRYEIYCPRKSDNTNYLKYHDFGGIAGFETHKGCGSSCIYCIEANTRVSFKSVKDVIGEIRSFTDAGFKSFHLCDSEFNEDLDYCIDFCTKLKASGIGIDWAVYMKPANYNRRLFRLMKDSGVSLITLTVDSWKKCPLYWSDIERIIFTAKSSGIRIVVDFLSGFPYEKEDTLMFYLDLFRRLQPDKVSVNTYIRLYKPLQITKIIMNDDDLRGSLFGDMHDGSFIKPVFYNQIDTGRLKELIGQDDIFRIEGPERGANYSRCKPSPGIHK